MKKLIIAEKPSLAKNLAKALGADKRSDGYLEGDNYIISWAFGHLFSLADVEVYQGEKKAWRNIQLPFVPKKFQFLLRQVKKGKEKVTDPGVKKQFDILNKLSSREDVEAIVNCGDADREGQIIADIIISKFDIEKPVYRLWLPDQTDKTIQEEIEKMKKNIEYKNLANEGYARTLMDWLLGINLTIYVSVKTGKYLPVGRVLIPILKFIYDRDKEISEFVREEYYQLESKTEKNGIVVPLTVKKKYKTLEEGQEYCKKLNSLDGIVEKTEKKEIKKQPGKLFSLSKLQSQLSKKAKINFKASEEIIQKLYEAGYITYPRTNTEFLSENEKNKVKNIISKLSNNHNLKFKDGKRIFDDSKIESHSAITPTEKIPKENSLPEKEQIVYNTILNRFISNFLNEETTTEKVTVEIRVGEEKFVLNGETIKNIGFYKYEPEEIKNNLPTFTVEERIKVDFKPIKKETQPPKKVTEEELSNHLKNPFRKEKQTEEEEYKAMLDGVEIGTEATRTGIVEKAKMIGYISQKASSFSVEELGKTAIECLDKLQINLYKEKTVEFSKMLKEVYNKDFPLGRVVNVIRKELEEIVSKQIHIAKDISQFKPKKPPVAVCPKCGEDIYENDKSLYCIGYMKDPKCTFSIWKENKYPEMTITLEQALKLIKGEKVFFETVKKDLNGLYSIDVKGRYVNFKLETSEKEK